MSSRAMNNCAKKVHHETRYLASVELMKLRKRCEGKLRVYRCEVCGKWLVGNLWRPRR